MTLAMQDHIHIDTVSPPVDEYTVYKEGYSADLDTPFIPERAVSGKLHAHRLFEGSSVKQFIAHSMRLRLVLAEKLVIFALAAQPVYYVPNYHDDDDLPSYIVPCYLVVEKSMVLDPTAEHWVVAIRMVDDTL